MIASYLADRKQYVQIEHIDSDVLPVGTKSVTQGSTLSCIFYLIFILDVPQIGHQVSHEQIQYRNCSKPTYATFVDDNYVIIKKTNKTIEEHVKETLEEVKNYMDSNHLALNGDKTIIMIISKKKRELKENFKVEIQGQEIKHSRSVKILGNALDENFTWEDHVEKILIPSLKNRIHTLKITTKYMLPAFRK